MECPLAELHKSEQVQKRFEDTGRGKKFRQIKDKIMGTEERWDLYFLRRDDLSTHKEEVKRERSSRSQNLFEMFNNRRVYDRKGNLFIKEVGEEKFSQRVFVLIGDYLYFYKDSRAKEDHVNIISLSSASVR